MCKQTLKKMQKREFILYTNRKTFMSIIAMTDRPKDKMNHILDDHWIKESKRRISAVSNTSRENHFILFLRQIYEYFELLSINLIASLFRW